MSYTVHIFSIGRAYGGPEEGGWYYSFGIPKTKAKRFKKREQARRFCIALNDTLDKKRDAIGYGADEYRAYVCETKPREFPATKPFYC
jgi:hypothetical protein